MRNIVAVIAAAGQGRRFYGKNFKLTRKYKGVSLTERLLRTVTRCGFSEILVITGSRKKDLEKILKKFPLVRSIRNPQYKKGLGGSISLGVINADPRAAAFAIFLADKPLVLKATIVRLLGALKKSGKGIAYPQFRSVRGHPVLFKKKYRPALEKLKGDKGAKRLLADNIKDCIAIAVKDKGVVRDFDTRNDFKK